MKWINQVWVLVSCTQYGPWKDICPTLSTLLSVTLLLPKTCFQWSHCPTFSIPELIRVLRDATVCFVIDPSMRMFWEKTVAIAQNAVIAWTKGLFSQHSTLFSNRQIFNIEKMLSHYPRLGHEISLHYMSFSPPHTTNFVAICLSLI